MAKRQRVSQSASIAPPIGGWNARDPLALMEPTDAVTIDNWFPDTDVVRMRNGYTSYSGAFANVVLTLMAYQGQATQKFFAAAGGRFWDITTPGTNTSSDTGHTNDKWQHVMFGTPGGSFLFTVNGADAARYFDGTNWTQPVITVATSSTFVNVMVHQQRLWFIQKDTLNAWYLPPNSIAGAAVQFPFLSLCRKGGTLVGMGSWTIDAGAGMDDYAVFITSEGEAIVYQGTDPSSASTWALVGVFQLGRPIGYRAVSQYAGDLNVICEDGIYPISQSLQSSQVNPKVLLSDKIRSAFLDASQLTRNIFGWEAQLYTRGRMLLFNIPSDISGNSVQFVMNTITGAWCRFTNQNASCLGLFNGNLYFGGNTRVYRADNLSSDNNSAIRGTLKTSFSYFGDRAQQKRFTMVRPVFQSAGNINPALALCVNFNDVQATSTPSYGRVQGSPWNTSPWNTSPWTSGIKTILAWQGISGIGFNAALKIVTQHENFSLGLTAIDYLYEPGGLL